MRDFRRDHPRLGRKRRAATEAVHASGGSGEPLAAAAEGGSPPTGGGASASEGHAPAAERRHESAGEHPAERKSRLTVVLSVLIAVTSLLGALAAWQAETASMRRDAANGSGFAKSVADEQAQATIRSNVESELLDYERAQSYLSQAAALRAQARSAPTSDSGQLRAQAMLESDLASKIVGDLDQDAFGPGHVFDPNKEFEIDYELAKTNADFDSASEFALAEHQATKADRLVGLTVLLIAAAFFFTLAQVSSRRPTARLYLGGGLAVLVLATTLLLVVVVAT